VNSLFNMTPKEIVEYLDKYVIGQGDAKRVIAIALRNRWRRMQLDEAMAQEVTPKNILMIGSTGVGKTEIARRLAKMMNLPFVKVEASKYTEVGFVGRDVESMVRDLALEAYSLVKKDAANKNKDKIEAYVENKIIEKLLPKLPNGASEEKLADYDRAFAKKQEQWLYNQHITILVASGNRTVSAAATVHLRFCVHWHSGYEWFSFFLHHLRLQGTWELPNLPDTAKKGIKSSNKMFLITHSVSDIQKELEVELHYKVKLKELRYSLERLMAKYPYENPLLQGRFTNRSCPPMKGNNYYERNRQKRYVMPTPHNKINLSPLDYAAQVLAREF